MHISFYQACYYAHELTRLGAVGELDRLSSTLFDSKVDLNPHQIEAALFAIANPLQKGVILADEVGLGKTIEAGLVLCQKWAERRRKLLIVGPAHIRKQWQLELAEKFNLPSIVIDRKVWNSLRKDGNPNPFDCGKIAIISYGFAARMKDDLRATPFDLVVFDEAHKLRNAYQSSRKGGQAIRWAFELRHKLLLTATPLQNKLLELYGLGWFIDDHIFGDKSVFQSRYANAGGDLTELKKRMSSFCTRTLRKDCPYVNYRERHAMTHHFDQTTDEKLLHEDVLKLMDRDISFAFPHRQRHLIEMTLFKTLASSPQALAGTLKTIRQRLVATRDGLLDGVTDEVLDQLVEDGELDIDEMLDQMEDGDNDAENARPLVQGRLLAEELAQIDSLITRADKNDGDSKSKALLAALPAAFARMESLGAKRKALIFTESRKTQAFLASYLEANGYAGEIVTFNGSNTHPSAKQAYDRFTSRHAGTDKLTGSKAVDIRSALIEEFREHADILLATEAAAEGVNLQFCSLVVNYDLPWNPQRVEQRIGRCHRYGQLHDVVVVNFLSQNNLADRRVHDLLQQKFNLFDGLFGASDDVLGAIGNGVDFEKRVMDILKTCRTDEQIEAAFDALQLELKEPITQKMIQARQQLFDNFDADVHERLKIQGQDAQLALDRVGERFWKLTQWGLDGLASFDEQNLELILPQASASPIPEVSPGRYRLISAARADEDYAATEAHLLRLASPLGQWLIDKAKAQSLPVASVQFDVSHNNRKISMLQSLVGHTGWLHLDKLILNSDAQEEFLLFTAVDETGQNIDQEQAQRLMDVDAIVLSTKVLDNATAQRLAADGELLAQSTLHRASEAGSVRYRQAQNQINQWADDKVAAADWHTREYLEENDKLVVDTRFFDPMFKADLLASEEVRQKAISIEKAQTGLLINGDNFQALSSLNNRYSEQISCIYIDPPYNTDASEIIYKNGYKSSSWASSIENRIQASNRLLINSGILCLTIDDFEFHRARIILDNMMPTGFLGVVAIKNNPSGRSTAKGFSISHEYAIFYSLSESACIGRLSHSDAQLARYKFADEIGAYEWVNFRKHGGANANRWARRKLYYPIFISEENGVKFPMLEWNEKKKDWILLEKPKSNEQVVYPITPNGEDKTWKWGIETAIANPSEFSVRKDQSGSLGVYRKARLNEEGTLPLTVWDNKEYSSTEYGTNLLKKIFGESEVFSFPKSVHAVKDSLRVSNLDTDGIALDYFAGSGTTGHAVINLNREDDGNRKFILVEMGAYFHTVLKPRITKVLYSPQWKDGKAQVHGQGTSALVKYFALESYDDALNNLPAPTGDLLADADEATRDAMITYSLDLEMGPSLLNLDAFADPWGYAINAQLAGEQSITPHQVDLVETFNYLLGLKVHAYGPIERYVADFERADHADNLGRLKIKGRLRRDVLEEDDGGISKGHFVFQRVEGELLDGTRVLVVWRKLTSLEGSPNAAEEDAAVLDAWMARHGEQTKERSNYRDYHQIYINGPVTLEQPTADIRTVFPIEQTFKDRMFEDCDEAGVL